ncbi:hypothetical protein AB0L10_02285 [Streptomyces flaveolus]|uniref:hypothetical protein n=1 Tax=Streptomyces flaveolus TaxID=67297 RepID=UPI00343FAC71
MAVDQLPGRVREFASYLDALLARLDPRGGWNGVFWQRDPEGMRACLDGREVPPWDVVEALLEDLGALYGPAAAGAERERARALHAAAVIAYDARPGARDALADRLDVMLREQRYAAERHAGLSRRLSTPVPEDQASALRLDLAWAHDDHTRATSRCAELRTRLETLDRRTASGGGDVDGRSRPGGGSGAGGVSGAPEDVGGLGWWSGAGEDVGVPGGESGAGGVSGAPEDVGGLGWWSGAGEDVGVPGGESDAGGVSGAREDLGALGGWGASAEDGAGTGRSVRARPVGVQVARGGRGAQAGQHGQHSHSGQPSQPLRPGRPPEPSQPAQPGPAPGAAPASPVAVRPSRAVPPTAPRPRGAVAPDEARHGVVLPASASWATAPDVPDSQADGDGSGGEAGGPCLPGATPSPLGSPVVTPSHTPATPTPKPRKRRRGSARFAGVVDAEEAAPVVVPRASGGVGADGGPQAPRGARFAGAGEAARPSVPDGAAVDEGAREAVDGVVGRLARLRGEGRSGEAHVVLVEAARWPVGRLPLLAEALHRAGLGADWTTLLWEAAALPAERLVPAADALAAAGRDGDGRQLLRQGAARPAEQIGAAVLRMEDEGRRREVRALLDAYVRVRTPEEAARCVAADPGILVPLLLEAALGASDERHWDVVHALRVAGYTT